MSESLNPEFEKIRFNTESLRYISPLDPYRDRVVQFLTLKQLGYPVDLLQVPVEEIPEDFVVANEMEWERDNYPIWVRPIVHSSEFEKFIEDPDIPGDCIRSDDEELDSLLENHPMRFIHQVDIADVHMLAYEIDCIEKDEVKSIEDSGEVLLTKNLLISCFMAALDRYVDHKARGYQDRRDNTWMRVTVDDFIRHKIYELQGLRPASPEQLGALVIDYYKLAERAQPEFLKFKNVSESQ